MLSKPLQILRAMWTGIPFEHEGYTLHLLDREDGKGKMLAFEATSEDTSTNKKETVYLGYDVSVNELLVMLEAVPDEQATIMSANAVLTQINREGGPSKLGMSSRRGER